MRAEYLTLNQVNLASGISQAYGYFSLPIGKSCKDPLKTCTGHTIGEINHEYDDGRRYQAMASLANKGNKMKLSTKHDDWLFLQLKDANFAAEFLNAASQDDEPKTYLVALRKVVEARGGMAFIAEKAELSRETLY